MKYDVFLFIIILILCALLVGTYLGVFKQWFNREGFSDKGTKTTVVYTAPNGATALVKQGTIEVTNADGTTSVYTATKTSNTGDNSSTQYNASSGAIYYGPDGGTATVTHDSNGSDAISITGPDGGNAVVFQSPEGAITTANNVNESVDNNNNNSNTSGSNSSSTYDNYNHFDGTSSPTVYYGPDGATARVVDTGDSKTLVITNKNGTTEIYTIDTSSSSVDVTTYIGSNGRKAVVAVDSNGKYAVSVTAADGSRIIYYEDNVYTYNNNINNGNNNSEANANANMSGTTYDTAFNTYSGPDGGTVNTATGPAGNTAATYNSGGEYDDSLPAGISQSQIPAGQEDLYILKSEVVPPVCPMCPNIICPEPAFDDTKCGPCPPCERISNNDFECKKVPNYSAGAGGGAGGASSFLPVPVISDFSGFGM